MPKKGGKKNNKSKAKSGTGGAASNVPDVKNIMCGNPPTTAEQC
jgi:hypothetical protein